MKKILKITGLVLGSLLGLLLILYALAVWRTGSELETRIKALREAGDPVTLSDLARPAIPPEKNAAVFLRRAESDIKAISKELGPIFEKPDDKPLDKSDRKAIRSALRAYPKVIPLLEQAAACPDYNPDVDYTAGLQAVQQSLWDRVQSMRVLARMLKARARLLAAEGDREAAVRTCILLLRLDRRLEREPFLINYLVTIAIRTVAVETANEILRSGPVPDKVRDELEAELALNEGLKGYQHALKTERVQGIESFRDLNSRLNPLFGDDECHYLDLIKEQLALSTQLYADEQPSILQNNKDRGGLRHRLSNLVFPAILKVREAMDRTRAHVRCLRVLNALQRQRKAEPTLADLGLPAEATTDPFNGEPLHLKKGPDGWIVYSVGMNLKDDGGRIADHKDEGLGPVKIGK